MPDLDRVIAETARVLAPGGVYVYETINRTLISKLFLIKAFQEWSWTRIMPPHLHDWRQFITPHELLTILDRHGLEHRDLAGLRPTASLLRMVHVLRQCRRGAVTYAEAVRRMQLSRSRDTRLIYLGYAVRRGAGPAQPPEA